MQHDHKWLRQAREAMGLEQKKLGEMMGFTPNSMYRKESETYRQKITERDVRDLVRLMREATWNGTKFPDRDPEALRELLKGEPSEVEV